MSGRWRRPPPYADQARLRAPAAPAPIVIDRPIAQRLTLNRRPVSDLPLAAGGAMGDGAPEGGETEHAGGDADMASPFDVPAFLRRQEG